MFRGEKRDENHVAYYTKTGNTERIAKKIRNTLKSVGEVDLFRIEMVREYSDRLLHLNPRVALDSLFRRKPDIKGVKSMKDYDVLILGCPIWFFTNAPPVNTFIEKLEGVKGKKRWPTCPLKWEKKTSQSASQKN
ncbi:MAG: flavodoxin family protein [Candidatus Freyrarchaeum guaymaensis]